jgi:hypothetical protein
MSGWIAPSARQGTISSLELAEMRRRQNPPAQGRRAFGNISMNISRRRHEYLKEI